MNLTCDSDKCWPNSEHLLQKKGVKTTFKIKTKIFLKKSLVCPSSTRIYVDTKPLHSDATLFIFILVVLSCKILLKPCEIWRK